MRHGKISLVVLAIYLCTASAASTYINTRRIPHVQDLPVLTGAARAYDGDSLFFGKVEVRLEGIDAPERAQACGDGRGGVWPCGLTSRDALQALASGPVRCLISGKDRYRRLLGVCFAQGRDMNAAMVLSGNAIAYHYYSDKYASEEQRAKKQQAGIWRSGEFTEPYYCRHTISGHPCTKWEGR